MLQLGEDLLDWVKIGTIGWQEDEMRTGRPYQSSRVLALVTTEIVEDDDVARAQRGNEHSVDVDQESLAIDRSVDDERCIDTIVSQGGEEGQRLPMTVWDIGTKAPAAWPPAPQRGHVGLDPRLVDEQQAFAIDASLVGPPPRPLTGDVGTGLLGGPRGFF